MTSKGQARLAFEAAIRANATSYRVHLFLGRGQFDRAEATTTDEALALGAAMKAAHPTCQAQPMFYAIEPSGHSIPITPAQMMQQEKPMTNVSAIEMDAPPANKAERSKKAEAQARYRAKQKAAEASRKEVAKIKAERKAAGPKANGKAGKAKVSAKAPAKTRAPGGKRAGILAKAERGVLPPAPDFSAPTHARFREKLHEVVVMAMAGNLAGLKKFAINPVSSSPKAIDKYRNLAIIALKARAANGGAQTA
jgi:hypothetical protein